MASQEQRTSRIADRDPGTGAQNAALSGGDKNLHSRKPRRGILHTLCRLVKWTVALVLLLLLAVGGALYYFIFTLDGARTALTLAQKVIPQSIIIDTTIEGGSVYEGLQLGKTLVDVKDIVAINADDLVLKYDLQQLWEHKLFKVSQLESTNLSVALSDQIFAPKDQVEEEPTDPNAPPFRLVFPVDIDIDRFLVNGFNFSSQSVDVDLKKLDAVLWAKSDNIGINGADVDSITVHLKNQGDVEAQVAEAEAVTRAEEALAIKTGDQIVALSEIDQAVEAVVSAAQHGQSVEVVMLRAHNEQQAAQTEAELLSKVRPEVTELKEQYSDWTAYADALESALLNDLQTPTLVNERPTIHVPTATELSDEDFERQLLAQAAPAAAPASAVTARAAGAGADPADPAGAASAAPAGAAGAAAAGTAAGAAVKEFGSGNGAIATLPTVVLPFNAVVKDFVVTQGRYYMDGFDTQTADLSLDATWYDTKLEVQKFTAKHELGAAEIVGSLNFDQYFDLSAKVNAHGATNDTTKTLFEGVLYDLLANAEVSGNLTDLRLKSSLSLGGSTTLKARANVLSSALPMRVSLQAQDFSYPIFAEEPLVNLQRINLKSAGNLEDGVDVSLNSLVSGFDFENVATDLKAQISYEKSHIDHLVIDGLYQKEKLAANVSGDFFYGEIMGADAKIYAEVKDAGFLSPMLKGPLMIDGDLVALLNKKEQGKSALSVASKPVYLENRIPKTSAVLEDFDPDSIEAKLLAQVRTTGEATVITGTDDAATAATDTKSVELAANARKGSDAAAQAMERMRQTQAEALGLGVQSIVDDQVALGSNNAVGPTRHEATPAAVRAVRAGESLSVVRPLRKQRLLAGGVPDEPTDILISQSEYEQALSLEPLTSEVDEQGQPTFLSTIFNQDMPEVMANVRYLKGDLYFNGHKTKLDVQNIVGNLQQGFRVELLEVTQANNTVLAEGQVTERGADLNAIVDIQDFSTLVPSLKGSLVAHLISSGSIHDLNIELMGSAPLIRSGDMRIRKLAFNSAFNMQTRALNFTALADRVRLAKGMAANRQCFIDLSGTPLRHSLSANCGGTTAAYISVDGSLDLAQSDYTANLMELYLSTESAGSLSLSSPVNVYFNFNDQSGELTPVELRGEIGQLNVSQTAFSPFYTKSHITVREFNLSSLKDFFPDSVRMTVPLNVDADVLIRNGDPDITVAVNSDEGVIYSTIGAGIVYDSLDLNAQITKSLMRTTLEMSLLHDRGYISSQVDIIDPMGKGRLGGFFKIDNFDLATISNIGQSFTELTGLTNVDMTFAGDLSQPLVYGSFKSKGTAVPRYDVGQINDFDFDLQLQGNHGALAGNVVLNGQLLKLQGDLDWSEGANGSLVAQARELPVFLVGYGIARTNLDANITLGEVLDIKGKVEIPRAQIQVQNVASSGVSVSGDEIIVPSEGTSALMQKAPSNFKSAMDLQVHLGDEVHFSAMGMVEGRLVGDLAIKKAVTDATMKANGEINIVDGLADVYGRRFNFSTARVIFFDDIANPNLNIEVLADKEYLEDDDVDVGVRVTGTASAPDINLFSKPAMSQNEILSYILYGHGLDKNVLNQESNNSGMLLGLGISGVSSVMSSLASSFGMNNVQFNTQGSGDDTQFSVEGYVSRRLRLSYGYGVFSAVGEFKVRYELIQNLYAEFVSSIDQAVDLIYSFEFD